MVESVKSASSLYWWGGGPGNSTSSLRKHLAGKPHYFPKDYLKDASKREMMDWHDLHHLRRWKKGLNGKPPMSRTVSQPLPDSLPWENKTKKSEPKPRYRPLKRVEFPRNED